MEMETIKRLGLGGKALLSKGGVRCPDIFELKNGDFLVIGEAVKNINELDLPVGASCDENERAVLIPHCVMVSAIEEFIHEKINL